MAVMALNKYGCTLISIVSTYAHLRRTYSVGTYCTYGTYGTYKIWCCKPLIDRFVAMGWVNAQAQDRRGSEGSEGKLELGEREREDMHFSHSARASFCCCLGPAQGPVQGSRDDDSGEVE